MTARREEEGGAALVPETDEELLAQCRVDTFRSGGKGGQHQNVTESGVRLTHESTGIVVIARNERSQHRNRTLALARLRRRLRLLRTPDKERVPTGIPRGERRRRLDEKRRKGATKDLRKPPPPDE
ncbi:MAG: peptide chain release factor-like protein [Gemmatimonadetes bacterium]|nr:peptide chain release factor-like protein [Gemmatimonadota bacterium]